MPMNANAMRGENAGVLEVILGGPVVASKSVCFLIAPTKRPLDKTSLRRNSGRPKVAELTFIFDAFPTIVERFLRFRALSRRALALGCSIEQQDASAFRLILVRSRTLATQRAPAD